MALSHGESTLAFTFGMLGNVISFMVYLAPLPTFYRIYKKKSTENFQSVPYVVALFSSMLWLYYAMLKKNAVLLISINSFGCVIETIYITVFLIYASKGPRTSTIKLFLGMIVGMFSVVVLVTQFAFKGALRVQVLGWICVSFAVCVFAAPLSIVARVIKTKSVEFMPLNLSLFLTLSATMWFAYGLFLKDICIAVPNVLGFALGLIQMILYAIYRKGKQGVGADQEEKKGQDTTKVNMVVLSPVGTSAEVYPADAQPYVVNVNDNMPARHTEAGCPV